jgi:PAS domain S-box-containing protein
MPTVGDKKVGASTHLPAPLVLGIAIAFASILVLASYFLWQSRGMLHDRAANSAETISNVLGQYVLTAIHEPEVLLQMASDEYRHELQGGTYNPKAYADYLSLVRKRIPAIANLRVADASGQILFSETGALDRAVDISDRPYFTQARDNRHKLVISPPVLGKISQEWVIPVAWRLDGLDGRFDGLLVANLSAKRFTDLFASLKAGPKSAIILFDSNTSINLRHPEPKGPGSAVGLKIGSPEFRALWETGARSATYRAQSTTDGIWRTYSYRQVGDYPLFIMVGVAEEDVLAPWRFQVAVTVTFLVGLMLLVGMLMRSLRKSIGRQQRAYQALQEGQTQLEESEARFRSIIEAAPIPFALNDDQQVVVYLNSAFVRTFGYNREDIPTLSAWWPKAYPDPVYRQQIAKDWQLHMENAERDNAPFEPLEAHIQCKNGERRTVLVAAAPLSQSFHDLHAVTFYDITERKRTEAELIKHRLHLEELVQQRTNELMLTEARATHILESSADGLYGVDRDGKITFINPAACQMLGCTAEQVIGQSAHARFHHSKPDGSPYPVEECPSHAALRRGHEVRADNETYWHADGHPVPVMFAAHPMIQDGRNGGAVISFVDMSEQRAAALARERAIVAAENLARVRSEFLSNMSHEIRTPINGVLGFAEIGYRNCQDSDKARNAFDKIRTSGNRLLGVINDILDFSKIEAGKLHVERITVALSEVIEQTVDVVRELARAKHLDLRVEQAPDLPQSCIGDPLRIGQVLLNLLSNAVKFTEKGSVILAASCVDNTLIFRVTDTGIGMNDEQMRQLFAPFQQGDGSMTRRFGGTGLGLTIAKRIAELMEAEIRVESQPAKGSTFELRLPYVQADAPLDLFSDTEPTATAGKRLVGVTILVAEDDPINQEVLEFNLTEDGALVVMVSNGLQAVERILQDGRAAYDIVLMDMQMPELDGIEATQRILELAPDLPIIGQTANAFAVDRDKCLAAGMVGHIAKPIDPEALVSLVLQHALARPRG